MIGYYTCGAGSAANVFSSEGYQSFANVLTTRYLVTNVATNTVNAFIPPIKFGTDEFGVNIHPSLTPSGFTLSESFYYNTGDFSFSIGGNTNGDTFYGASYHFSDDFTLGWYRTDFGGDMSQGVAGVSVSGKNWSFSLDEDLKWFGGDGDDRYRTGGFQATIGDFAFGGRVMTNDLTKDEEKATHSLYETPSGKIKLSPHGVYDLGEVTQSLGWVGYKGKYGTYAFEHNNPVYQDAMQNGIHKYYGTSYFQADKFNSYSMKSYRNNPYSIYYY